MEKTLPSISKKITNHSTLSLAKEAGVVVLNGDGFDGPRWSIRVSLANLDEMNYRKIGTIIGHTLEEYAQKWKNETAKKEPVIY